MSSEIVWSQTPREGSPFELVECKFRGHPDTLADDMADHLSMVYSIESVRRTGRIWNHNFDKVGVLGGHTIVEFGGGEIRRPIRVLLNGRFSPLPVGGVHYDIREILRDAGVRFLAQRLENVGAGQIVILDELSTAPSPGGVGTSAPRQRWFTDFSHEELDERQRLCNDTAVGVGFAPLSEMEQRVIHLREALDAGDAGPPELGTDIKLLAWKTASGDTSVICAAPAVSTRVPDIDSYVRFRSSMHKLLLNHFNACRVVLNGRDRDHIPEIYLTLTGSSIESGDEGLVGRGNRPCGFTPLTRPVSLEADRGKHPIYHSGKVLNNIAAATAARLSQTLGEPCRITLIGLTGAAIESPALVGINCAVNPRLLAAQEVLAGVLAQRRDAIRSFYEDPSSDSWTQLSLGSSR